MGMEAFGFGVDADRWRVASGPEPIGDHSTGDERERSAISDQLSATVK
jgi:hypothetical protein